MGFMRGRCGVVLLAAAAVFRLAAASFFAVKGYTAKNEGSLAPAAREEARKSIRLGGLSRVAIALVALAAVYLLINRGPAAGGVTQTHVVQPSLWAGLALLILLLSRLGEYRLSFSKALVPLALLAGAFHLSVLTSGGMLVGFGHSPLSHSAQGILINLTFVFSSLVALELTRAYLLTALGRRPVLALAATALLFTFVSLSLASITSLDTGAKATSFLGETGLPLLAQNLLASYLALLGGALPAIAYRGMLEAYESLSPILPNLPWAPTAFLGTVAPVIGFLAVRSVLEEETVPAETGERFQPGQKAAVGWVSVSIVAVGLTWFALGLFPVYPVVTAGHSMAPTLREGDLVIMREVSADSVEVGDIIQYSRQQAYVLHRVVEATGSGPNRQFVTKGDGNNAADSEPVPAEAVRGEVLFYIPKLGHVATDVKEVIGKAHGMLATVGGLAMDRSIARY